MRMSRWFLAVGLYMLGLVVVHVWGGGGFGAFGL